MKLFVLFLTLAVVYAPRASLKRKIAPVNYNEVSEDEDQTPDVVKFVPELITPPRFTIEQLDQINYGQPYGSTLANEEQKVQSYFDRQRGWEAVRKHLPYEMSGYLAGKFYFDEASLADSYVRKFKLAMYYLYREHLVPLKTMAPSKVTPNGGVNLDSNYSGVHFNDTSLMFNLVVVVDSKSYTVQYDRPQELAMTYQWVSYFGKGQIPRHLKLMDAETPSNQIWAKQKALEIMDDVQLRNYNKKVKDKVNSHNPYFRSEQRDKLHKLKVVHKADPLHYAYWIKKEMKKPYHGLRIPDSFKVKDAPGYALRTHYDSELDGPKIESPFRHLYPINDEENDYDGAFGDYFDDNLNI